MHFKICIFSKRFLGIIIVQEWRSDLSGGYVWSARKPWDESTLRANVFAAIRKMMVINSGGVPLTTAAALQDLWKSLRRWPQPAVHAMTSAGGECNLETATIQCETRNLECDREPVWFVVNGKQSHSLLLTIPPSQIPSSCLSLPAAWKAEAAALFCRSCSLRRNRSPCRLVWTVCSCQRSSPSSTSSYAHRLGCPWRGSAYPSWRPAVQCACGWPSQLPTLSCHESRHVSELESVPILWSWEPQIEQVVELGLTM